MSTNLELAIAAIRAGKIVGIIEKEKENETDLCKAACFFTPDDVRIFKQWGSGLMYVTLNPLRADQLGFRTVIPLSESKDPNGTNFQTPVNLHTKHGLTTGMSYHDRATTIKALASPEQYGPSDFMFPGHTCVLKGHPGGLRERQGHTEASLALMKLAGVYPVAVLSEITDQQSGEALTGEEVTKFAAEHDIPLVTVEEIKAAALYTPSPQVPLPIRLPSEEDIQGQLVTGITVQSYQVSSTVEYVILTKGDVKGASEIFLRIHSECLTGDILHSDKCDCGPQWEATLKRLSELEKGVAIYVRGHEGRGIGLCQKLQAYELQSKGMNTKEANEHLHLPADARSYPKLQEILREMGVVSVNLHTSNAKKVEALGDLVVKATPFEGPRTENNSSYLDVKFAELNGVIKLNKQKISDALSSISPAKKLLKPGSKIALIQAKGWRKEWLAKMYDSCVEHIEADSLDHTIISMEVSGCFELPLAAQRAIRDHGADAVIALGILVDGRTYHFTAVTHAVTDGLMRVMLDEGVPVVDGILYCLNESQVAERVEGDKACTPGWVNIALDKDRFTGYHHYSAKSQ